MISRRERLMLIVAIVLLGGIVFKYLIYDPQQAQYETLVTARDAAAAELARDERVIARAEQDRAEYDRIRTYIATVEQKLPLREEIPALLTAMEQFTQRVGVTFQSIRPGSLTPVTAPSTGSPAPQTGSRVQRPAPGQPPTRATAYSSVPVDITVTGTFAQTVEYLRGLRSFPRLVIVDSISLTPQIFPKLGVSIKAEIYTLGIPAEQALQGGH
ncbi:MAG TPA: type 4a pilus biogenesis protein PilO [bacterium]|nr:type 4a pilus biogenesis protein PilO [bacterium]